MLLVVFTFSTLYSIRCFLSALQRCYKHCFVLNCNRKLLLYGMKKWLAFILLLIATAGTFIPCCPIDTCCADQPITSSADHQDDKKGTCSPFFSCTTCPGFVQLTRQLHFVQPPVEAQVHGERVVAFNLSTYATVYWQPPRAG